jgi:carbon-monoxide dehydrogenase medium subunit
MQVPAPFEYARARSVDEAIALLEDRGETARLLAGGHSLLPMMKLRFAGPEYLIDINDLHGELGYIRPGDGEVRIGAMTRHRELLDSDDLAAVLPVFRDAERVLADPVVRNRGTIGGSLCQADPAEDLAAVCLAVGAACVIRGRDGDRVVPIGEFYRGPFETAVGAAEMLVEVRVPVRPGGSSAYEKVERRAGDWAIMAVGTAVWLDGGVIADARAALAAAGPTTRAVPLEDLRGQEPSEEVYRAAGDLAARHADPMDDLRGSVEYKRHLAAELTRRALRRSVERATGRG